MLISIQMLNLLRFQYNKTGSLNRESGFFYLFFSLLANTEPLKRSRFFAALQCTITGINVNKN